MRQLLSYFLIVSGAVFVHIPHAQAQIDLSIPPNALVFRVGADTSHDFSTITAALNFASTALIDQPYVFLLTDSTYPNDPFPITIGAPQQMTPQGSITIQPDNGVHVIFENPAGINIWIFSFHTSRNTKMYGRSPDSTGTITIIDHSPFNKRVISLSVTQSLSNVNTEICYLTIKATHPSNQLTGIDGVGEFSQRLVNTLIAYNRFEGLNNGVRLRHNSMIHVISPHIYRNFFGGTDTSYSHATYPITLTSSSNALVEENEIAYLQNSSSITGILIYNSANAIVLRNRIHHIRVANEATGIATGLSTHGHLISNHIHSFGSLNPLVHVAQLTGIDVETGATNIYHNTISLSDSGNHTHGAMYAISTPLQNHLREVANNIFELKSTKPQVSSYVYYARNLFSAQHSTLNPNNNVYLFTTGTDKGLARRMGQVTYFTLESWRNELQANGSSRESFSFAGNPQLYSLSSNLLPDSLLAAQINDMGRSIPLLSGMLNHDLRGQNRPAFGSSSPDPGATEFNAARSRDLSLPILHYWDDNLRQVNHHAQARSISFLLSDSVSGIFKAEILLNCNTSNLLMPLQRDSGTAFNGLWKIHIAHQAPRGCYLHLYITDSTGNRAVIPHLHAWEDALLDLKLGADTILTEADSIVLQAESRARYPIRFTEFLTDSSALPGSWPAHLPADLTYAVELTHFGTDTLDISGLVVRSALSLDFLKSFEFPKGTLLYPQHAIIVGNSVSASGNGVYHFQTDSTGYRRMFSGHEFALYDRFNQQIDYLPIDFNPLTTHNLWHLADSWHGGGLSLQNTQGAAMHLWDLNRADAWLNYGQMQPSPGLNHLSTIKIDTVHWQWIGIANSGKAFVESPPLAAGHYPIRLQIQAGTMHAIDSMNLRISGHGINDFIAPQISQFSYSPQFHTSCISSGRAMEFMIKDTANGSGIERVELLLWSDSLILSLNPLLDSGTVQHGKFLVNLPSLARNSVYLPKIFAVDSSGNQSDTLVLPAFTGRQFEFARLGPDTTISYNTPMVKHADVKSAKRRGLQFTEFVYDYGIFGSQPTGSLPAGLSLINQHADVVKITNLGKDTVHTGGIRFSFHGQSTSFSHAVPALLLAPGQDLYLVSGGSVISSPAHRVYQLNAGSYFSSSSSGGLLLVDSLSGEALSALALNNYSFPNSFQLPLDVWGGAAVQTGQSAGLYRTASPATAASWQIASHQQNTQLGQAAMFQLGEPITWRLNGQVVAIADTLRWSANRSVVLTIHDTSWSCSVADSLKITVIGGDNPADLAIDSILFPNGTAAAYQLLPQIRIMNLAGESVSRVGLQVIWNGSLVGSDLIQQLLFPGDSLLYNLSEAIDLSDTSAGYTLCIKHLWPYDTHPSNDELCVDMRGRISTNIPQEMAMPALKLYPNPSRDQLFIELPAMPDYDLEWTCYDYLGRLIPITQPMAMGDGKWQLSIAALRPGQYQLLVTSKERRWHAKFQRVQ
ncbi:MAG: hypothetical protein ACK417_10470 [Bacteroidia bacterium]